MIGTVRKIAAEEGALKLWDGLFPGLQRQVIFAGLRIGLYVPVRDIVTGPLPEGVFPTLGQKILTGIITGGIAISFANPTDLVKVKMQGQGVAVLQGQPRQYANSFDCYRQIIADGGVKKLWTGYAPNLMRNCVINAAELASYDQYKQMVLQRNMLRDGIWCHIFCATCAGCTACVFGSPVDVLKTRVMNAPKGMYSNPVDCFLKTLRNEGPSAFYKGFIPNCVRLSSWNVAMFVTVEQLRKTFMS